MTPISGLGKAMTVLGMLSFLVVLTLLFGGIEHGRDFPSQDTTASLRAPALSFAWRPIVKGTTFSQAQSTVYQSNSLSTLGPLKLLFQRI